MPQAVKDNPVLAKKWAPEISLVMSEERYFEGAIVT